MQSFPDRAEMALLITTVYGLELSSLLGLFTWTIV
jgi:hypothetical protein